MPVSILDLAGNARKPASARARLQARLDALRVVEAYGGCFRATVGKGALKIFQASTRRCRVIPWCCRRSTNSRPARSCRLGRRAGRRRRGSLRLGASLGRRAAKIWVSFICSCRSTLCPAIRWRCCRLPISMRPQEAGTGDQVYERVPANSPLRRNAEIQLAVNLDALERTDEAQEALKADRSVPMTSKPSWRLATFLRGRKQFAECARPITQGRSSSFRIRKSELAALLFPRHLQRALEAVAESGGRSEKGAGTVTRTAACAQLSRLFLDRPGRQPGRGHENDSAAVEQRPDDGYIVDSLGWAYYRIGNYEESVKHWSAPMELQPEDPTINDHLGDVYWRVGRMLEAQFQWAHARDLKPEPEELPKIEEKLKTACRKKRPRRQKPATRPPRRTATAADAWPTLLRERAPAKVNLTLRVVFSCAPTVTTSWKAWSRSQTLRTL